MTRAIVLVLVLAVAGCMNVTRERTDSGTIRITMSTDDPLSGYGTLSTASHNWAQRECGGAYTKVAEKYSAQTGMMWEIRCGE